MAPTDILVQKAAAALARFVLPLDTDVMPRMHAALAKAKDVEQIRTCVRQAGDSPNLRRRVVEATFDMLPTDYRIENMPKDRIESTLAKLLAG